MKLTPKLFATFGLILTAAILLSVMLLKSTKNSNIIVPTPTPTENIINPVHTNEAKVKVTNLAIKNLINTENLNREDIEIKNIEEREWPDASLGCPKPGSFYAQVITSGYLINLKAAGKIYSYHTSLERVIPCN